MASKDSNHEDAKPDIWSSLLDGVASGKQLPEKLVLVLGGSADLQKDFLETLDERNSRRASDRNARRPPISNELALGYTYQDVLDADHEDTLARLSIYTLQESLLALTPLVKPLFTPKTIPESLVVVLLDWAEPWNWLRQIRDGICFLYGVVDPLQGEEQEALVKNARSRSQSKASGSAAPKEDPDARDEDGGDGPRVATEWEDAFGLSMCFVCHNSNKIDTLERDYSWREEEFDYLLQFLRTVLLRCKSYGASLIYTASSSPNSLPLLVRSSLNIYSPLRRETLKHNVVDRDRILIPPKWDSWSKIKVIREGFDIEGTSRGWSSAMQASRANVEKAQRQAAATNGDAESQTNKPEGIHDEDEWDAIITAYEETIRNPKFQAADVSNQQENGKIEVASLSMQEFLAKQSEFLEKLRAEEEKSQDAKAKSGDPGSGRDVDVDGERENRINQHLGPVQFNMGGIQVDAEDMLKSLRNQEREETPARETGTPGGVATPEGKQQHEALANFFAGLIKKGGRDSPKPGGK